MTAAVEPDWPVGGVTAPRGFRASGVAAGISTDGGLDLALVVNDGPTDAAAGVFTTNRVRAAPVLWSEQVVASGRLRAVVLNAGGANACTGPAGFEDTHATAEQVAEHLGLGAVDVAVCSTGLIGERLPMPAVRSGVAAAAAALTGHGGDSAAYAILTTDTVAKQTIHHGPGWTLGGMAKGAGMLAPDLATMLAVLTTDAAVDPTTLDEALRTACRATFDRLDSDGCTSTNDTILLLASGATAVAPPPDDFTEALTSACAHLTRQLLADFEGSTKDIAIEVTAAASEDDAVRVGRAVARSALVKCALHGEDPNWGRVLAAVGTTTATFEPDALSVDINGVGVCRAGAVAAPRSQVNLTGRDVHIRVDLAAGAHTATVWTNDLSPDYVHENSAYST